MRRDFIYLASASPRRRALLEQIDVPHRVLPARLSEVPHPRETPEEYVLRVARAKAEAVWQRIAPADRRPVLAADTAVVADGRVLGKPADPEAALAMLTELSGRSHTVLTGVALRCGERLLSEVSTNEVRFRPMTAAERAAYCATGEPLDKAGGYAIQGLGAVFIERIEGSYSAVMGLPLERTAALLAEFGFPGWLREDGSAA